MGPPLGHPLKQALNPGAELELELESARVSNRGDAPLFLFFF